MASCRHCSAGRLPVLASAEGLEKNNDSTASAACIVWRNYSLSLVLGCGGWWLLDSIMAENPIFTVHSPEGNAIAAALGLVGQLGTTIPLLWVLLNSVRYQFLGQLPPSELRGIVQVIVGTGIVASGMLVICATLWNTYPVISGHRGSYPVLVAAFVGGIVGGVSAIYFWPLAARYGGSNTSSTKGLSLGIVVGGGISQLMALVQNVGNDPIFTTSTFFFVSAILQLVMLSAIIPIARDISQRYELNIDRKIVQHVQHARIKAPLPPEDRTPLLDRDSNSSLKLIHDHILIGISCCVIGFLLCAQTCAIPSLIPFIVQDYDWKNSTAFVHKNEHCDFGWFSNDALKRDLSLRKDALYRWIAASQPAGDLIGRFITLLLAKNIHPRKLLWLTLADTALFVFTFAIGAAKSAQLAGTWLPEDCSFILVVLSFVYRGLNGFIITMVFLHVQEWPLAETWSSYIGSSQLAGGLVSTGVLYA
eukprot:UC4_evm1s1156